MREKNNIKFHILAWLLFAVILTLLIAPTTFSRYITTVKGADTAEVATVALAGNAENASLTVSVGGMEPGDTRTFVFQVTNTKDKKISDVAQSYTITIDTTGNLPLDYLLSAEVKDNEGFAAEGLPKDGGKTTTAGRLPHTASVTHTYTLTVEWPLSENDPKYADEVDAVYLVVDSQQVN